jgi:chemotaxis protein CheX
MITEDQDIVIDHPTLAGIVGFVWETFTQRSLEHRDDHVEVDGLSATISIGGPWTATLEVTMSSALAARFAGALLACDPATLTQDDIDDAIGELANVVGGNVKGMLEDGSVATLSLPVVSRSVPSVTGGHLTVNCTFDADGEPMVWSIFERVT